MKTITITLDGWKGIHREYTMDRPTVLNGPVGAGKSAVLEAIAYALTGRAPHDDPERGSSLDHVARFFEPRGGTVRLSDGEHWVERGITIDHESGKVSVVLNNSDDDARTDRWDVGAACINISEFAALSPERRRAFILQLCGAAKPIDAGAILQEIHERYVKLVSGNAAKPDLNIDELPPEEADLQRAWTSAAISRDVEGTAVSAAAKGTPLHEALPQILKGAKAKVLEYRGAAREAKAAIQELEAEARGAEAGAAEVDRLQNEVRDLRGLYLTLSRLDSEQETRLSLDIKARTTAQNLDDEIQRLKDELARTPKPGPQPKIHEAIDVPEDMASVASGLRLIAEEARLQRVEAKNAESRLHNEKAALESGRVALARHEGVPAGRVASILAAIPDDAHQEIPKLRRAVGDLTVAWTTVHDRLTAEVARSAAAVEEAERRHRAIVEVAPTEVYEKNAIKDLERAEAAIEKYRSDEAKEERQSRKAYSRWQMKRDKRRRIEEALARAKEDQGRLREKIVEASQANAKAEQELGSVYSHPASNTPIHSYAEVMALDPPSGTRFEVRNTKLIDVAERLAAAELKLGDATRIAGALDAYRSSRENAERAALREKAWKVAVKAIEQAREDLVSASVDAFIGDIAEDVDRASSRKVYCDLENHRGRPTFDLGWLDAERAAKVSLASMSNGQAATFCAALKLAIMRRSEGRRFFLMEVVEVGDWLPSLLSMLRKASDDVDAMVLATNVRTKKPEGWDVVEVS